MVECFCEPDSSIVVQRSLRRTLVRLIPYGAPGDLGEYDICYLLLPPVIQLKGLRRKGRCHKEL